MQIWLFFAPGTGGDGIANLLEHSSNAVTIDHGECDHATPTQQFWRVDRFVDNRPKFWAPTPDQFGCFRIGQRFEQSTNKIRDTYAKACWSISTTIVTSHDYSLQNLKFSDCAHTFTTDQMKIFLYSTNSIMVKKNALEKNLIPYNKFALSPKVQNLKIVHKNFDHIIDIDHLVSSWTNIKSFTDLINLDLDKKSFDDFCFIKAGKVQTDLYSNTTPEYKTVTSIDGDVTYIKL
jgi:hypothetical protein